MNKRNPILGLMTFSFYDVGGNVLRALPLPLIIGITGVIFEVELLLMFFPIMAITNAPYVVMMKSEGTPTWDKFQIAMPIRRKDIASTLYLNVFIASLLAIPVIGIVWLVGYVVNGSTLAEILTGGFSMVGVMYGAVLLSTAILYPLGLSPFGKRNIQSVFFGSLLIAVAIAGGLFFAGSALNIPDVILPLLIVGISGIAFVISLFITRAMYTKIDF